MGVFIKGKFYCFWLITGLLLVGNKNAISNGYEWPDMKDSCFVAGINCRNAYVYDNPLESNIIDSLDHMETFVAYDRNDSAFFYIKRIRPIEMMSDSGYVRSYKTIYGYVKQSDLLSKTDEEILNLPEYMTINRCRKGLIDDVDGYTNIRKERSVNAEISGRILDGENFLYWVLPSGNWHLVQTETGIRGFVYKDRVKEYRPRFRNYVIK
ncbi:MAG: hypothetical protein LBV74_04510 [Tannerella sp.]|jgi:hypothetical protein|nr:hypothetical protein [Tannerella sp.]